MIVFRTFLKVLKACKVPIIMYTAFLIAFGALNMQTSDSSVGFASSRPDIMIINYDEEQGITENLIKYMEQNCNIADVDSSDDSVSDALFYRDADYIIYIPDGYREDFLNNKNPEIQVKSTGEYQSSLAEMMLTRYVETANIYRGAGFTEEEIISGINDTLSYEAEVELTSNLDADNMARAAYYYNFASYSILAGCVYVICLILSSFKEESIRKRTIVSSMNYKEYNRKLLVSNALFSFVLWAVYVAVSFVLLGSIMFTMHGLMLIINSLIFTGCALTIAFLIGNLVSNKNAINGIVNVVALGSSFLCGAFVPMQWIPDWVLKIAHILPTYYYIASNEKLTDIEEISLETMRPVLFNMAIILAFAAVFIIITNIISGRRRKIA